MQIYFKNFLNCKFLSTFFQFLCYKFVDTLPIRVNALKNKQLEMLVVKKINALETYSVRQEVLRKGKPIETCYFHGDEEPTTTHFGLFKDHNIIGIVSVFKTNTPILTDEIQFQIRGMAVLENFQSKGLGTQLLNAAEKFCWEEKANVIWFNAREKAIYFYKKMGYEIIDGSFEIENIGTHFVMLKRN